MYINFSFVKLNSIYIIFQPKTHVAAKKIIINPIIFSRNLSEWKLIYEWNFNKPKNRPNSSIFTSKNRYREKQPCPHLRASNRRHYGARFTIVARALRILHFVFLCFHLFHPSSPFLRSQLSGLNERKREREDASLKLLWIIKIW